MLPDAGMGVVHRSWRKCPGLTGAIDLKHGSGLGCGGNLEQQDTPGPGCMVETLAETVMLFGSVPCAARLAVWLWPSYSPTSRFKTARNPSLHLLTDRERSYAYLSWKYIR